MKSLKNSFFIGLTAVAMATGASVYAQSAAQSSPSMDKPGGMGMHGADGMDHAKMAEKMKAGMEKHQKELHDKLKLTAAQEPAWKTFTDAIAPGAMPAHPDRATLDKMTAPERMEKMLAMSKERQAKMEGHLAALKTFYAVLTPEQKKILDTTHNRMHDRHMQHGEQGAEHKH